METGGFLDAILGSQCMCTCLCGEGPDCAWSGAVLPAEGGAACAVKLLTVGSAVPGGRKAEGWSPAELPVSLTRADVSLCFSVK